MTIEKIKLSKIDAAPEPIRSEWDKDEMKELAASIKEHGLLQPPGVRKVDDRYEIIFGHRRLEACEMAGLTSIEANVITADDGQSLSLALIENICREDMIPKDKALALQRLMAEMNLKNATAVAKAGVMPRKSAAVLLKLLEQPSDVQDMVGIDMGGRGEKRKTKPLTMEHVQRSNVTKGYQDDVLRKAAREGLTAKQTHAVAKAVAVAEENQDEQRARSLIFTYPYSMKIHNADRESERYQPVLVLPPPVAAIDDIVVDDEGPREPELTTYDQLRSLVAITRQSYERTADALAREAVGLEQVERHELSESLRILANDINEFRARLYQP